MALNLIFLGAPGAGKGTVAEEIVSKFGLTQISTGDLVRAEVKSGSKLGKQIEDIAKRGELVSDEIIARMLETKLKEVVKSAEFRGVIFDGFPRNLKQAEMFESILKRNKQPLSAVINIDASEQTIVSRLSSRRTCPHCKKVYNLKTNPPKKEGICNNDGNKLYQRTDDTPKAIKNRFRIFLKETTPLVKHYTKLGLLHGYNGNVPIRESAIAAKKIIARIVKAKTIAAKQIAKKLPKRVGTTTQKAKALRVRRR
ncbi:MAG: nucleoside monophosphate kinase [archaeon]|jgi:adenylate kinase